MLIRLTPADALSKLNYNEVTAGKIGEVGSTRRLEPEKVDRA